MSHIQYLLCDATLSNSTNGWGEAIQQIKKITIDYVHGSFDVIFS